MSPSGTLSPLRGPFRALTVACVPAAASLDEDAWTRALAIVDGALADRPAPVRRQLALFVRVVEVLARLRHGKGLERLAPERTRRLLEALERSPLLLLRRGTWGLRTLAFMGYYGQEDVRRALGYAAALRGWESRGAGQGPWADRSGAAPPEPGTLTAGRGEGSPPHA